MTLNAIQKKKINDALLNYRKNNWEGSDREFAKHFELSASTITELKKGNIEGVISSDKLVSIARKLGVHWRDSAPWTIVHTAVFDYITEQMKYCQANSIARIFCDKADIGKTTAAKEYMMRNKNVYYLDCSRVKSKTEFIRALAVLVGVGSKGALKEVIGDIIWMLQAVERPLIVLDEAGDLAYEAWLEIKALWNALEGYCGWYMMGADGLKKKIDCNLRNEKVGYAEIFRRFGSQYMTVCNKVNPAERKMFYAEEATRVAHANLPQDINVADFVKQRNVESLTRLKEDILKIKNANLLPLQPAEA